MSEYNGSKGLELYGGYYNWPFYHQKTAYFKVIYLAGLLVYGVLFDLLYNAKTLHIAALVNFLIALIFSLQYRRSPYIFPILFIYCYALYSIFVGRYFHPEISPINSIIGYEYDKRALEVILWFTVFLIWMFRHPQDFYVRTHLAIRKTGKSLLLTTSALSIGVLLQIVFFDVSVAGERAAYTPHYEYAIVFYILALYYSNGLPGYIKWFVVMVVLFFAIRDFYYGHRVTGLQMFMAVYFFRLTKYYSFSRFIGLLLFSIPLLFVLAIYRSGFSFNMSYAGIIGMLFNERLFAFDTAYYAYVTSLTFLAAHDYLSFGQIFIHLKSFLISLLLPGTYGESLYQISKNYYAHVNGGILPLYFYFYFSWFAVPLSGLIVAMYMNIVARFRVTSIENSTSYRVVPFLIFSYVFVTSPRWILYSPNQLLRGVMIFTTVLVFSLFAYRGMLFMSKQRDCSRKSG